MDEQCEKILLDKKVAGSLLSQVSILIKKNDELLAATGARFNMFKACGVNHYENTHSKILAELLNPKGSHDMGSVFLEAFLCKVLEQKEVYPSEQDESQESDSSETKVDLKIDARECKVRTEVPFNYKDEKDTAKTGRMDILIVDHTHKSVICIENKIYAQDQREQLKRYNSYLNDEYQKQQKTKYKHKIVYLTLSGYEAKKHSGDGVSYIPVSYKTVIVDWLEDCIKLVEKKPMIQIPLHQYRNHIRRLTGTNLEIENMKDAIELLCSNQETLRAAKEIAKLIDSAEMRERIVTPLLGDIKKYLIIEASINEEDIIYDFNLKSHDDWDHFGLHLKEYGLLIAFKFKKAYHSKGFQIKLIKKGLSSLDLKEIILPDGYTVENDFLYKVVEYLWPENAWVKLVDQRTTGYNTLLKEYTNEIDCLIPTIREILKT